MEKRVLAKLEFDRIRQNLAQLAASSLGREMALALEPMQDYKLVLRRQEETTEAREILRVFTQVPLAGIYDLRPALKKARIGGILEPRELLDIADTLAAGRRLREFMLNDVSGIPLLQSYAREICLLGHLEKRIRSAVANEEELADNASETLYRLRRQIRSVNNEIRDYLDKLTRSSSYQKYLQEPIVTLRADRYVIPVKQEYRSFIPGIVHDQSASGATLFIEPMAVLELHNRLREYRISERKEVELILTELSEAVAREVEQFEINMSVLGQIDFTIAKARYSMALDAVEPVFNKEGFMDIRQGRHPLLAGDIVPVDVHVGKNFHVLVITGPNTGGKTVTLKTIGLFAVMAQAGLHLPAAPGTETTFFDQVFVDIGDEQSIAQSLSTFSGHMKNIVEVVKHSTPFSLVLLDELGAGTDPAEGAALGMAILHYLHGRNTRVVATTHYSELKTFAYSYEGIENAAVEFDIKTLQPTFKLMIGVPGRSNAFEIAQRLGLPEEITTMARDFRSEETVRIDDLVKSLEESRIKAFHDREEAARARHRFEKLEEQYEKETIKLKEQRNQTLLKARQEALSTVNRARREAELILEKLKKESEGLLEKERAQIAGETRQEMGSLREELDKELKVHTSSDLVEVPSDLEGGESVYINHLNMKGYVLAPPANGQVMVQVGAMKVLVELEAVRLTTEETQDPLKTGIGKIVRDKTRSISSELDLRGLTGDEALYQVEKYLDDAYLAGLDKVYLIHGKGTGVLRKVVQEYLVNHPHASSYRVGSQQEGGMGVTVVQLAK